ncbi:MAG TPA: hypothetical protein VME41_14165 [Stellaceae bacterium]|nr:hypothetical protein [Stellaceae bacterium]
MAAFEWMELQTLTSDITVARSRLAAARSDQDHRRVRQLEQEIAAAEGRRSRLLAFLTNHLADAAPPAVPRSAGEDVSSVVAEMAADALVATAGDAADATVAADEITRPAIFDPADREALSAALAADVAEISSAENSRMEGDSIVWEQLTPGDLERAEQELAKRREEMLARHAEELKTLDADRDRLASLEQAIAEFLQKFGRLSAEGGEVVQLGDERELRAVGRA